MLRDIEVRTNARGESEKKPTKILNWILRLSLRGKLFRRQTNALKHTYIRDFVGKSSYIVISVLLLVSVLRVVCRLLSFSCLSLALSLSSNSGQRSETHCICMVRYRMFGSHNQTIDTQKERNEAKERKKIKRIEFYSIYIRCSQFFIRRSKTCSNIVVRCAYFTFSIYLSLSHSFWIVLRFH